MTGQEFKRLTDLAEKVAKVLAVYITIVDANHKNDFIMAIRKMNTIDVLNQIAKETNETLRKTILESTSPPIPVPPMPSEFSKTTEDQDHIEHEPLIGVGDVESTKMDDEKEIHKIQ